MSPADYLSAGNTESVQVLGLCPAGRPDSVHVLIFTLEVTEKKTVVSSQGCRLLMLQQSTGMEVNVKR